MTPIKVGMNRLLILALAGALPWSLAAQDSGQAQLPNAPSTSKYPPPPPQNQQPANQPSSSPANSGTTSTQNAGDAAAISQNSAPGSNASQAKASSLASPGSTPTASTNSAEAADDVPIIRKRVDGVNVSLSVTDKRDHFVKDRTKEDFHVIDDNKPGSINSFSRQ